MVYGLFIMLVSMAVFFGLFLYWIFGILAPQAQAEESKTTEMYKAHCTDKAFFDKNARVCIGLRVEPIVQGGSN